MFYLHNSLLFCRWHFTLDLNLQKMPLASFCPNFFFYDVLLFTIIKEKNHGHKMASFGLKPMMLNLDLTPDLVADLSQKSNLYQPIWKFLEAFIKPLHFPMTSIGSLTYLIYRQLLKETPFFPQPCPVSISIQGMWLLQLPCTSVASESTRKTDSRTKSSCVAGLKRFICLHVSKPGRTPKGVRSPKVRLYT